MCQKVTVFKKVYAVMMTSTSISAPRTLQVFKHNPSQQQVDAVVQKYVINKKVEATGAGSTLKMPPVHMCPE